MGTYLISPKALSMIMHYSVAVYMMVILGIQTKCRSNFNVYLIGTTVSPYVYDCGHTVLHIVMLCYMQ